jgi:hypothetical protein
MMRLALPHMKARSGTAVINVASISGWSPQLAMSGQYGAAKAALIFGTERWALEFVPYGIRVNTVSPGSILVEGNGWDRYRLANPGYFEDYVRHGFPMGRLGTAEEVADVIVFTRQQAAASARRRSDTAAAECYVALPAGADTRAQRALFHYRQNGTRTSEGAAPDLGGTSPALLPRQGLALGAKPGQSYAPRVNKMSVALTIPRLAAYPARRPNCRCCLDPFGMLFDTEGNRMTPSSAVKKGRATAAKAADGAPPLRNQKFADSPLEGGGFELSVPR